MVDASIQSREDIIIDGLANNSLVFDLQSAKFWGNPLAAEDTFFTAIAPEGMTQQKWAMLNAPLTDEYNHAVSYKPIVSNGSITGLKLALFADLLSSPTSYNNLWGALNKLLTFRFNIVYDSTRENITRENCKEFLKKITGR